MGVIHVQIEVLNEEAMAILEQLERLNLIRMLEQNGARTRKRKTGLELFPRKLAKKCWNILKTHAMNGNEISSR